MRVKVSFRPDTEVADLLVWYSTFTCTSITVGGGITLAGKKISILSPTPVTRAEVDQLFLGALESVGLTIAHEGRFLTVIDAARARHSNTPIVMPPHQQR